ncbi:hypothetical protein MO973_04070 [Paenibacillus sp. TRM 82003]|uniref:hypothetical protein n=1 Tax=Kineococcus sp. TRM81007 TaxID=2925831 RepID=UPI001F58652B|nr:hypothetical protein [Kineococcus sp. TRM81007]MCI2237223.1 hypothetical protein [Kineococcus sp. TRM81007]MCI3919405.1 hypothetical protein [Paenibacillus sp. TRM 82003]
MANVPWPREAVVQALRERLLDDGAVTDGFTGLDVRPALAGEPPHPDSTREHEHVVVLLRWRQDPHLYAIAVPLVPGPAGPPPPGVHAASSVHSLQSWAEEVVISLAEDLDTGLVQWARRTQVGDATFLSSPGAAEKSPPEGYYVGPLYLGPGGDDGAHLADVGLDVSTARRLLTDGRLLTWLHAYVNNARGEPYVGHAVVARAPAGVAGERSGPARLEVLQVVPGTPGTVSAALAYHAVREAVEAGAQSVSSTLGDPVARPALEEVGFRRGDSSAELSVTWREVRRPDLRRR